MLNRVTIMGRMTRDPELRRTGSGVACTSFTLAVDRDVPNGKGEKETDFIDCVAWRKTGEFVAKYFKRGQMTVASGRLQIRNWVDKNNNKRRSAEVIVDDVYFGSDKKDSPVQNPGYEPSRSGYGSDFGGSGDYAGSSRYSQSPPMNDDYAIHDDYGVIDDDDAQLPF